MSIVAKALAADSESARSLKSPLLTSDACPDSKLEIEQSDGAVLPAPQASSQPREGCQRPGGLPKSGDWEICIQNENAKIDQEHANHNSTLSPASSVSIFRVPSFLKVSTKSEAYVPKIVSLGPYHHGRAKLKSMEIHKERAVRRMMMRSTNTDLNTDFLSSAIDKISQDKDEIMKSYEVKYDSNPKNMAMMVKDGCFILEILRSLYGDHLSHANVSNCYEPIFVKHKIDYTGFDIVNCMLMLENQIPLIVLQKLLELEGNDVEKFFRQVVNSPIAKTAFCPFFDTEATDDKWWNSQRDQIGSLLRGKKVTHLLGLWHSLIAPPDPHCNDSEWKDDKDDNFHEGLRGCAVELKKAGIKFEKLEYEEMKNPELKDPPPIFSKIRYEKKKSTIYLPPITVTDHTEVLFRNLIALELCKRFETNYVICYVNLMDTLINSREDVAVLTRSRVITHHLGSDEEVAKLFNGLCRGVTMGNRDKNFFKTLRCDVDGAYENTKRVQFVEFVDENCASPWKFLALVGAVIGLVLSLVTTIFSILAVVK